AALTRGPRSGWPLPQWLAGVTRNLARRSLRERSRRNARELAAARREHARPTDEVVELEELRTRVVNAVMALDEPYRSVVLLRYYDGLEPRQIAAQTGAPAATVRSQLHRALAQLRERLDHLDDANPDERRRWQLLLPLVAGARPSARALPKALAAAVLILGAAIAGWAWSQGSFAPPPQTATADEVAAASRPASAAVAEFERTPAALPTNAPEPATASLRVRFVGEDGEEVTGTALQQAFSTSRTTPTALAIDDAALQQKGIDGILATLAADPATWTRACALHLDQTPPTVTGLPATGRHRLLVARPGAPAFLSPPLALPLQEDRTLDVRLPPKKAQRTVRLVADDTGAPLSEATVRVYTEFGDDRGFVPGSALSTDARGECIVFADNLAEDVLIRPAVFWLETATHSGRFAAPKDEAIAEIRIKPKGRITGRAFDLDGKSAARQVVAVMANKGPPQRVQCDDDGNFAVTTPAGRHLLLLVGARASDLITRSVSVPPGGTLEVELGSAVPRPRVEGRITAGGAPLAGVTVGIRGQGDARCFCTTDRDGHYVLRPAGAGFLLVMLGDPAVSDDFGLSSESSLEFATDAPNVFDFDLPRGTLRVKVQGEVDGEPIANVPVGAIPAADTAIPEVRPGFRFRPGWVERTGPDGTALLRCLPAGVAHEVRIGGNGTPKQRIDVPSPSTDTDPKPLIVRLPRTK
ncbi:MAG: sigma-70 family RNA polymerase sigma factor, partial [Planctomycetes bacterium]|nr:sigma-70 family RNA polymerase sigma factor [Planctomycetota bacterium]